MFSSVLFSITLRLLFSKLEDEDDDDDVSLSNVFDWLPNNFNNEDDFDKLPNLPITFGDAFKGVSVFDNNLDSELVSFNFWLFWLLVLLLLLSLLLSSLLLVLIIVSFLRFSVILVFSRISWVISFLGTLRKNGFDKILEALDGLDDTLSTDLARIELIESESLLLLFKELWALLLPLLPLLSTVLLFKLLFVLPFKRWFNWEVISGCVDLSDWRCCCCNWLISLFSS